MINDFDKKVYQSTKAPIELKSRVMESFDEVKPQKKNTVNYKKYLSLAACLILVIGVSAFFSVSKVSVSVNENGVGLSPASYSQYSSLASERSLDKAQLVLVVDLKSNTKTVVNVKGGTLTLFEKETGEKLSEGNNLSFKGDVVAFWDITALKENTEMTVSNFISKKTVKAEYDAQSNSFKVN